VSKAGASAVVGLGNQDGPRHEGDLKIREVFPRDDARHHSVTKIHSHPVHMGVGVDADAHHQLPIHRDRDLPLYSAP
jgi:hypothetical protein